MPTIVVCCDCRSRRSQWCDVWTCGPRLPPSVRVVRADAWPSCSCEAPRSSTNSTPVVPATPALPCDPPRRGVRVPTKMHQAAQDGSFVYCVTSWARSMPAECSRNLKYGFQAGSLTIMISAVLCGPGPDLRSQKCRVHTPTA